MRRNWRGVGCAGKMVERQAPLCVCVRERKRERGREGGREGRLAPRASSPMLTVHGLAHTAFGIRGGEEYAMILDLVMR